MENFKRRLHTSARVNVNASLTVYPVELEQGWPLFSQLCKIEEKMCKSTKIGITCNQNKQQI